MKMQAVITYEYPKDEEKLKRDMHAEEMYAALQSIINKIDEYHKYDDAPDGVILSIKSTTIHVLNLINAA